MRIWLILLLSYLLCGFKLLEVDHVSMDFYGVVDHRDAYTYEYKDAWKRGTNFNLNLRGCEYLFLDNQIQILGTQSQVREASWKFRTGIELGTHLQLYYEHWSRHLMDTPNTEYKFPLDNYYGLRVIFLERR